MKAAESGTEIMVAAGGGLHFTGRAASACAY